MRNFDPLDTFLSSQPHEMLLPVEQGINFVMDKSRLVASLLSFRIGSSDFGLQVPM